MIRMGKLGCKELTKREVNVNKPCMFITRTNDVKFYVVSAGSTSHEDIQGLEIEDRVTREIVRKR